MSQKKTRAESRFESSLVQLSDDIGLVYRDLKENLQFSMSLYRFAAIQSRILSGLYNLSPLRVKFIEKGDLFYFLQDALKDCPDIMLCTCPNSKMFCVVMPEKDDALVLISLSVMLFRLSHGSLPKHGYRLENLVYSFYYNLQQMGKVDRLYMLYLQLSIRTIPTSLIEEKIKHLVGDDSVYKLISSFLNLPIIDYDINTISLGGIPPVGQITKVLLNIILMHTFDREFPLRFPGITFYRFINEVFISTTGNVFDEKAVYSLLGELGLAGRMVSIGPGDDPLLCYHNMLLYLDSDSKVYLCDPKEYY